MKNQNILQEKYVQGKKYCAMFFYPSDKILPTNLRDAFKSSYIFAM